MSSDGSGFVNLHMHSHYSILDGYATPEEYIRRAARLGQTALALTDHGNMYGIHEFIKTARDLSKSKDKKGHPQEPIFVKPIAGMEAYVAPLNPDGARCKQPVFYGGEDQRSDDVSAGGAYLHLTLLAINDVGFHNLIRLSTESFRRENFYKKQRIDQDMLARWNEGVVAFTGCPSGEVQTRLRLGQVDEAYDYARRMKELFPGRYYVEVMEHHMKRDLERDLLPMLVKMASDLDLPLVATNDSHYSAPSDAIHQEEMLCINQKGMVKDEDLQGNKISRPVNMTDAKRDEGGPRFAFDGDDYYLKSEEEMLKTFPDDKYPGAVSNTVKIANMAADWWSMAEDLGKKLPHAHGGMVDVREPSGKGFAYGSHGSHPSGWSQSVDPDVQKMIDDGDIALGPYDLSLNKGIRPKITIPDGWTERRWFQKKINDGFENRRVAAGDPPAVLNEAKKRISTEFPVFADNDFMQYMLVVQDYINAARSKGIAVGYGRGSCGGSEIAYDLDISRTDPIRHNLLFERFLNPERVSPPDVDTDFQASRKNEVLVYAKQKYGADKVANIITFGTFGCKTAFRDMAKIYTMAPFEVNKISKLIPDGSTEEGQPTMAAMYDPSSKWYAQAADFRRAVEAGGDRWSKIGKSAAAVEGRVRSTGTHACGVIMSDEQIVNRVPLCWESDEKKAASNVWVDCKVQWGYEACESLGLIKMDFLSLSDLDVVKNTLSNIEGINENVDELARSGSVSASVVKQLRAKGLEPPDLDALVHGPMDDKATYEMLGRGDSVGCFQLGSDGIRDLLRMMKPTVFDDIAAVNALYRPGPMKANAHIAYADRKNGREQVYVIDPILDKAFKGTPVEDILKPTWGCMVYQEQVMQISQRLCGYSRGGADSLRKAIGHKIPAEMERNHAKFVDGAMANNADGKYAYTREDVEALWQKIDAFSSYGFNKCADGSTNVYDEYWRTINIVDLLKRWNNGDRDIKIMSMWEDGTIRPHQVKNVVYSGRKPVYKITLESGRSITITKEHRLLTTNGYGTIDDGLLAVGSTLITDDIDHGWPVSDEDRKRRSNYMKTLNTSDEQRDRDAKRMIITQSKITHEQRCLHQQMIQKIHPHRGDNSVVAMHNKLKELRKDPVWVASYAQSLATRGHEGYRGYGHVTALSDGRLCDSYVEAAAGEYLLSRGVDFELHKPIPNPVNGTVRICDFYADGIYFEMDGLSRGEKWFRDNKYGNDVPFVYMTPEDYIEKIDAALTSIHVHNGDKIVSISKYPLDHRVYDIEMELDGPSNFVANKGIVSHNSHAVSYGIVAYETAYLKAHYPAEFYAALMTNDIGDKDKLYALLQSLRSRGLTVGSINVNNSTNEINAAVKTKPGDPDIVFGFSMIKGMSDKVGEEIVKARKANGGTFSSLDDFVRTIPESILSEKIIRNLADVGAFECFGLGRRRISEDAENIVKNEKKRRSVKSKMTGSLFTAVGQAPIGNSHIKLPELEELPWTERLKKESDLIGMTISGEPIDHVGPGLDWIVSNEPDYRSYVQIDTLAARKAALDDDSNGGGASGKKKKEILTVGFFESIVKKKLRSGEGSWYSCIVKYDRKSISARISGSSAAEIIESLGREPDLYHVYLIRGSLGWNNDLTIESLDTVELDHEGRAPFVVRIKEKALSRKNVQELQERFKHDKSATVPAYFNIAKENADGSMNYDTMMRCGKANLTTESIIEYERLVGRQRLMSWKQYFTRKTVADKSRKDDQSGS